MALNTYSSIKTSVGNWLERSDLSAYIPDFLTLGENRIYRDCRVADMETNFSSTASSGLVALPSGYLELKFAYINQSPITVLERKDPQWVLKNYPYRSSGSTPSYIARDGQNFIFGPFPDSNYVISGTYYKKLTVLSTSNETNWITEDCPGLLLWAALSESAPFIGDDERVNLWEQKYQNELNMVMGQEKKEQFSGSPLRVSVA